MFKYELEINPDEMLVKIVPLLDNPEPNVGIMYGQRKISYKDSMGRVLFFNIWNFPDYLRCEDFPWERLKNLNEAISFVTMHEQYSLFAQNPTWTFLSSSTIGLRFDDSYRPLSSISSLLTCSCLCSIGK